MFPRHMLCGQIPPWQYASFKDSSKTQPSLVKIGSVTAEIFLIWTNVAYTNVTVTVGICFRCSQEPTSLKFSQNRVSNSWEKFGVVGWWWWWGGGGVGWSRPVQLMSSWIKLFNFFPKPVPGRASQQVSSSLPNCFKVLYGRKIIRNCNWVLLLW